MMRRGARPLPRAAVPVQDPNPDPSQLEAAIATLQRQRALLGDTAADLAIAALRQQLAAGVAAGARQLKQVSVLFTDIVGSTALARALDPEDTHALFDGALAGFTQIVQAHGGQVLQYAGDSVLAVFGVPLAREDDAERAVQAGLAILASVQDGPLAVRAGIHSGEVLLGGGVDGDQGVRGLTVHLAARMEQTAPPGRLRISQATWRLVRGRFDCEAQPPLQVKGHDTALATWLVRGPHAADDALAGRGVPGLVTPLVGRALPLARLQQAFTALGLGGGLHTVAVVGEAGLGKSRLTHELRRWAAAQPAGLLWLQALASEQRSSQPYGMLRALVAGHVGLRDSDTPAQARSTWLQALAPLLPRPADAALLGQLLGLDFSDHPEVQGLRGDTRQLRDRAFFHASQWLRALARQGRPLVALFDDLHWADDGSRDFIAHLVAHHADLPVLLLLLSRPGPALPAPAALQIVLEPLDAEQSGALADALLARLDRLEPALRERVARQGEGNPFYMEELVNMLVDQGVIDSRSTPWRLQPERLQGQALPATLVGVLQARLDALPPAARQAAQLASVVGHCFWDASLQALGLPMPQALQDLLERGLVQPQPASLEGLQEWSFRHHVLHQVAYGSVLRETRRDLHGRVARWLASLPGGAPAELLAEHLERGGEPAQALQHWQLAAEDAAARYANAAALAHAGRALALAPPGQLAQRYALTLLRCRVLELRSEREALDAELAELLALARQRGDAALVCEALALQARHAYNGGALAAAEALARQAVAAAPPGAAAAAEARARATLAQALGRLGRGDAAEAESALALQLARSAGATAHEGMILNDMGMRADERGDPGAAIALYTQALACHRAVGNRNNEGGTLSNLGYAALMLGDYEAAVAQFEQARELFAQIGQRQNEGITRINLGIAQLNQGQAGPAQQQAQLAHRLLRASGDRWAEGAALRLLGQAALALGDLATARRQLQAAAALFAELGLPQLALEAAGGLAEEALARGDLPAALAQVERVLAAQPDGRPLDGIEEPMRLQLACWRVLQAAQDPRAPALLQAACDTLLARAAQIADTARRDSFLQAVPHHRALLAAAAGDLRTSS